MSILPSNECDMDVWPHCATLGVVRIREQERQEWIRLVIHCQHEWPHEQEKQVVDAAAVAVSNVEELNTVLHDVAMWHRGLVCPLMRLVKCANRPG